MLISTKLRSSGAAQLSALFKFPRFGCGSPGDPDDPDDDNGDDDHDGVDDRQLLKHLGTRAALVLSNLTLFADLSHSLPTDCRH